MLSGQVAWFYQRDFSNPCFLTLSCCLTSISVTGVCFLTVTKPLTIETTSYISCSIWSFSLLRSPVSLQTARERRVLWASCKGKQDADALKTKCCLVATFWGNKHFNSTPQRKIHPVELLNKPVNAPPLFLLFLLSSFPFTSVPLMLDRIPGFSPFELFLPPPVLFCFDCRDAVG